MEISLPPIHSLLPYPLRWCRDMRNWGRSQFIMLNLCHAFTVTLPLLQHGVTPMRCCPSQTGPICSSHRLQLSKHCFTWVSVGSSSPSPPVPLWALLHGLHLWPSAVLMEALPRRYLLPASSTATMWAHPWGYTWRATSCSSAHGLQEDMRPALLWASPGLQGASAMHLEPQNRGTS